MFLLLLVSILAALWVLRPMVEKPRELPQVAGYPKKPLPEPKVSKPLAPRKPVPQPQRALTPSTPKEKLPVACIIIDDMGQNPSLERKFFKLGLRLNFSFLPEAPFTKRLATEAHARGFEVLVHLPLEAHQVYDHSHILRLNLNQDELKKQVRFLVKKVPYAIGVNHHMGSAFTEDETHVYWLLSEIKAMGLFYVDSRTTPYTKIPEVAKKLGLPFAERNIFLDDSTDFKSICRYLDKLIKEAQKRPVVAIGHPHPNTLKALEAYENRLKTQVNLVPISEFLREKYDKAVLERF
ncbi:divergent polysaccharide deacetylase family protein [Thermodesulfatator indicus]|uniref:divergent polysaccharide deacetylase family protein n=1 Tax=Thermodesulfatator indicus TaxID=171695 RepID=UPI00145EFD2F|nr:divergent polysaccharide deacetylase family protein [Thermodesulfatator indicus]